MLRTRVLTAAILVLILTGALFGLPPTGFTLVVAAVVLGIGGWEAARLAGLHTPGFQALWILALLVLGATSVYLLHFQFGPPLLFGAAVVAWLVLLAWVKNYELGLAGAGGLQPWKLPVGLVIILPAFAAFAWLHFHSPWLVVMLILIIAAGDTGAYFTGRAIGGPRLAPRISPGKTWSGAIGGLITGSAMAVLATSMLPDSPFGGPPWKIAAAGTLLVALSIGGDLLVSLLKRHRGLKDTSGLLPGHGGLLDRIDSLSAALPLFALLVWLGLRYAG